jgi:hypothetical protein
MSYRLPLARSFDWMRLANTHGRTRTAQDRRSVKTHLEDLDGLLVRECEKRNTTLFMAGTARRKQGSSLPEAALNSVLLVTSEFKEC